MGCHFLLQGIFLTQGSNLCLLHWQEGSLSLCHYSFKNGFKKVKKWITTFGENDFSFIKQWNAFCLLFTWSTWKQSWTILLSCTMFLLKIWQFLKASQIQRRFINFFSQQWIPLVVLHLHFSFKDHWTWLNKCLTFPSYALTTVLGYMDTLVKGYMDTLVNRENNHCLSGTVILWNYPGLGNLKRGCLSWLAAAWVRPSTSGHLFSHSEDAQMGPNFQRWVSPRDPKLFSHLVDEFLILIKLFCSISFT